MSPGAPASIADAVASRGAITIRRATQSDGAALRRLAALADRRLPRGEVVVAEVDGAVVAAVSTDGSGIVADPFSVTLDLTELLGLRAQQLRSAA
ncbi:MAG: hypothetical protein ACRC50_09020 [Gaiella sp.]